MKTGTGCILVSLKPLAEQVHTMDTPTGRGKKNLTLIGWKARTFLLH